MRLILNRKFFLISFSLCCFLFLMVKVESFEVKQRGAFFPLAGAIHEALGIEHQYNFLNFEEELRKKPLVDELDQKKLLAPYKIIFVRGIFTNIYISLVQTFNHLGIPVDTNTLTCFHDIWDYFDSQGIDYLDLSFTTEDHPDQVGKILNEEILKTEKKVILVSHSKGGIDVLHGLINHPEMQSKVAGWITFQAPFSGSFVSDAILYYPFISGPMILLAHFLEGDREVFKSMTTNYRRSYFFNHQEEISQLNKKIPIISFSSIFPTLDFTSGKKGSFFFLIQPILQQEVGDNDGLIGYRTACLYGSTCYLGLNMDHSAPVMDVPGFTQYGVDKRVQLIRHLLQRIVRPN